MLTWVLWIQVVMVTTCTDLSQCRPYEHTTVPQRGAQTHFTKESCEASGKFMEEMGTFESDIPGGHFLVAVRSFCFVEKSEAKRQ